MKLDRLGLLEGALPRIDYLDAYERSFVGARDVTPEAVRRAVFSKPRWLRTLLSLRDRIVAPFGLRGAPAGDDVTFSVLKRDEREVLLGESDKHLDFRILVRVRPSETGTDVLMATAVMFHNAGGRFYFFFVKPFHRIIVKAILRGAKFPARS